MRSTLSIGSTLVQGVVLLLGAFLILSYSFSILRQSVQDWEKENPTYWTSTLVFNLGLLGLYGLFVYVWVVEEMSDTGFRVLVRMLNGGV